MLINGLDRLFISVPNLKEATSFYQDTVGMNITARGQINSSILQQLWGLPTEVTAEYACLKNTKQQTALELVEIKPAPRVAVRDNAATYDYGYFNLIYLVPDSAKIKKILAQKDMRWLTEPYHYPPMWSGSDVIEGWFYGPSREIIAVIEYIKPPVVAEKRLEGDFWTFFTMALLVDDMEKAISFYRDALGFKIISDAQPKAGFFDNVLHFPKDTSTRVIWFNTPPTTNPAIEVLYTSAKGKTLNSSPLELGIFMHSFESDNLVSDIARVKEMGFHIFSGPIEVNIPIHGLSQVANIEGPNKIRVELFQKSGK